MKNILIIVTQDHGGAGEAMFKLAKMLNQEHNVALLVKEKTKQEAFVYLYSDSRYKIYKKLIATKVKLFFKKVQLFEEKYSFYSLDEDKKNISAEKVIKTIGFVPDFIFSGWTAAFMNSTDLFKLQQFTNAKVYNITVDMNHFTGGCHYSWDCTKYINGCDDQCPALIIHNNKRIALKNFHKKFQNVSGGNFKIIAGSGWTLNQAKNSKIYRDQQIIYNINSLIDTQLMNNACRKFAKRVFGFDTNSFTILVGCKDARDPRKGFDYLVEGLNILSRDINEINSRKIKILIVTDKVDKSFYESIPFEIQFIDFIKDYRLLSLLYQAADIFVNTSIEDSGPMMVCEALACGTPVVGFDMGIVHNMVINDFNGYKAILRDCTDLAKGIDKVYNLSKEEYFNYSNNAVDYVKKFSSLEYGKEIIDQILTTN